MKFRKNWKRFWTLDRHHAEGFTLVELIVVIAILAILAGVGTVGYSGYVKKANIAADEALAAEISNALMLAYYSGDLTSDGFVILSGNAPEYGNNVEIETALQATYGSNLTGLTLKYDGWSGSSVLAWASTNAYAPAVSGSTYFTTVGTEVLLSDVQNCASNLAQFLDDLNWSGEESANSLFGKINGVYSTDGTILDGYEGEITSDVLANATVFGIASNLNDDTNAANTVAKFGFDDGYIAAAMETEYTATSQIDITNFANTYAAMEAFVNYMGDVGGANVTGIWEDFNNNMLASSNPVIIANSLNTACNSIVSAVVSTSEGQAKFNEYYAANGQAIQDGKAYVGIMQAVNNLSTDYKDSLDQESLFTTSEVADKVNGYATASSMGNLPNISGSAMIVFFTVDTSGAPNCVIYG